MTDELLLKYLIANARVETLPFVAGVYFLFLGDEIVYIGQSTDVHHRVRTHKNCDDKPFDKWAYIEVPPDQLLIVEGHYIRMFQPRYNRTNLVYPRRRWNARKKSIQPVGISGLKLYDARPTTDAEHHSATDILDRILRPQE